MWDISSHIIRFGGSIQKANTCDSKAMIANLIHKAWVYKKIKAITIKKSTDQRREDGGKVKGKHTMLALQSPIGLLLQEAQQSLPF